MAVFVTNPRRNRARRTNGALNQLIAKKLGVNIRTEAGRKAVKAFKQSAGYKLGGGMGAALEKERKAKKARTADSKAYTKKTGKSRAAEFYASVGAKKKSRRGGRKAAASTSVAAAAPAAKRGGRKAAAGKSGSKAPTRIEKTASGKVMYFLDGKPTGRLKYEAAVGGAAAPAPKKTSAKKVAASAATKGKRGGKRKASSRKKNPYGFFRRTNGAVQDSLAFVKENALSMQGLTALALAGAAGAAHFYLAPMLDEQVTKIPVVGEYLGMAPYTLTGILAGAAVYGLGAALGAQRFTNKVAAAAVLGGPILDVMDYLRSGSSALTASDKAGVVYNGIAYSGVEVMSNPSYGGVMAISNPGYGAAQDEHAIVLEYGDAQESDAYVSGEDFDEEEGEALMRGPRAFFARFGPPPRVASRKVGPYSRHAGRQGHRWAWLIKLVGFRKAQEIAALSPDERIRVIAALREQAIRSLPAIMSRQAALPAPAVSPYAAMMADSGAMGAGGASAYGAVVYAGAGY